MASKKVVQQSREYDPRKGYEWSPEDAFVFNGNEFAYLYQALKNEVMIPGGISASQKVEVFKLIDAILGRHYEAGVGKESQPPQQEKN